MANGLRTVNLPGIAASLLAIVSIFLPWWGVTATGFGTTTTITYGFFGPPSTTGQPVTSNFTSVMTTYTPIILALALLTTALALLGSLARNLRALAATLILAVGTLSGYSALISYALSQNCQGNGCIRGPIGSEDLFNVLINWGFQSGYYLFLGAIVLSVIALVYHEIRPAPAK